MSAYLDTEDSLWDELYESGAPAAYKYHMSLIQQAWEDFQEYTAEGNKEAATNSFTEHSALVQQLERVLKNKAKDGTLKLIGITDFAVLKLLGLIC